MTATLEGLGPDALQARLETLRADRREQEQHAGDAAEFASEALTRGEDADEAIRTQVEAEARLRTINLAIEHLERLIPQTREAVGRAAAAKRLDPALKRALGSLANQYTRADVQRVEATAAAFVEAVQRLNDRYGAIKAGKTEALFLTDRFEGLEAPALPEVPPPEDVVREAVARVRAATPQKGQTLPRRLISLMEQQAVPLRRLIAGTPTDEILKRTGERPPGDTRSWNERHHQAMNESRDREDASRRRAQSKVDGWLTELLSDGPLLVTEVERTAEEAGIILRPDRNRPGESLRDAAGRVGVIGLVEQRNGPQWWAIGDYDEKRFQALKSGGGPLSAMRW